MQAGQRGIQGFTLFELMLALALGLILMGWAVPTMTDLMKGVRARAAGAHFSGMLETVRYRSLVQPYAVTICGTADGVHCDKQRGYRLMVFGDDNRNGQVDGEERVDSYDEFLDSKDFWLAWRSFQNKDYLRWAAGRTDSMNGTFTLCNRQRKDAWLRQIVVNRAGRTRTVLPAKSGGAVLQAARRSCGWG